MKYFDIELPGAEEIMEDGTKQLLEVTLKHRGIWRVHLDDKDQYNPSDFHGHNIDTGEKLDFYTGIIYDNKGKNQKRKLSRKDMLYFKKEIEKTTYDDLISKYQSIEKFIYLEHQK